QARLHLPADRPRRRRDARAGLRAGGVRGRRRRPVIRAALVALLLVLPITLGGLAAVAVRATSPTPPPPTLVVPGEQVMNGQSYLYTGPDGLQYHVYTQTNLVTTVAPYDDSAFTYFGTWNTYGPDSALYGGSDHWSDDPAASYGFLFSGTGVTVYVQTAPWFGIASYAVDGGMGTDFDAYSPARANQVVAFRSGPLAPGTHRLIVRN